MSKPRMRDGIKETILDMVASKMAEANLRLDKEDAQKKSSDQVAQIIEKAQAYARKHRHEGGAK